MTHKRLTYTLAAGLAVCLVLMGMMASSANAASADLLLTPTPSPDDNLMALARRVEADNREAGNSTTWRGGQLGEHDAAPVVSYGQKMAGFALEDVSGETIIIDRIEGPKLINFWATWCSPCIDEFPRLAEATLDANAPFTVLFVNVWDTPSAVTDFVAEQPEGLHILRGGDQIADDINLMAIPTSILIDSDGIVRLIHVGDITPAVMDFLRAVALELE